MEEFRAAPEPPAVLIRREVERAERYVGVLGWRYGAVDESSGFSMTELEYQQAVTSKKPIHFFVMDTSTTITGDMLEQDPDRYRKLLEFRARVLKSHVAGMFTDLDDLDDLDDLERKAEQTLRDASGQEFSSRFAVPRDATARPDGLASSSGCESRFTAQGCCIS